MSVLHVLSTVVVLLIAAGIVFRRQPKRHVACMASACVADVALVLYFELSRGVIHTVVHTVQPIVWLHAAISLAVLVCYGFMIHLGMRLLRHQEGSRRSHRNLAVVFCVLRLLNYVTSYLVV